MYAEAGMTANDLAAVALRALGLGVMPAAIGRGAPA
jgi:hypothetical protein